MNEKINSLKLYKKEYDYSYTFGAYATIELIKATPDAVIGVYIHSKYNGSENICELCHDKSIPVLFNDKLFERVNRKENIYVLGVFNKYTCCLSSDNPHVVLINPSDMGNLGTIIRTMTGLNMLDLAIVTPAADVFDPKTIRSSMGAIFRIRFQHFTSFTEYKKMFHTHVCFPFITDGAILLSSDNCPQTPFFSLLFGNEASGLPNEYKTVGTSIKIPQSSLVDSLNLSVAAGIGMSIFATKNGLI